jgi:hypothetical protein
MEFEEVDGLNHTVNKSAYLFLGELFVIAFQGNID